MVKVSSSIIVKADKERAYQVISDFKRYPKFVSEITKATVLKQTEKKVTASFEMNMVQKINYTLLFSLTPHSKVSWSFVEGDSILKDNSGSWTIAEQSAGKLKITYEANVELSIWLPESILKSMLNENLPMMLEKFKKEIEKI